MILKSLGHKTRSFGKLLAYVQRGAEADGAGEGRVFSRNLICDAQDVDAVRQAFEENARHLKARRGGNWCYHEIIALPKSVKEKTKAEGEAVLFELADRYVAARAPRQLVWGRVHWETDHPHLHLVISSNELRSPRRTRLPKAKFTKLVEELETIRRKLAAYHLYASQRIFQKFGKYDRFVVLFQTNSPKRAENMVRLVRETVCQPTVLVTDHRQVTPETVLQGPIWRDKAGEAKSLIRPRKLAISTEA